MEIHFCMAHFFKFWLLSLICPFLLNFQGSQGNAFCVLSRVLVAITKRKRLHHLSWQQNSTTSLLFKSFCILFILSDSFLLGFFFNLIFETKLFCCLSQCSMIKLLLIKVNSSLAHFRIMECELIFSQNLLESFATWLWMQSFREALPLLFQKSPVTY